MPQRSQDSAASATRTSRTRSSRFGCRTRQRRCGAGGGVGPAGDWPGRGPGGGPAAGVGGGGGAVAGRAEPPVAGGGGTHGEGGGWGGGDPCMVAAPRKVRATKRREALYL